MSDQQIAELRDALVAVREAIDIPHAATMGDAEIRTPILLDRIMHVSTFLDGVLALDHPMGDVPWYIAYLRERLAEHPAAGYKTWDEAMAELAAAKAGSDGAQFRSER